MNFSLRLQFVDDVEFWFPPGKKSIVQYRSASRIGNFDFDINRKRIKVLIFHPSFCHLYLKFQLTSQSMVHKFVQALRVELEKKGWSSENTL